VVVVLLAAEAAVAALAGSVLERGYLSRLAIRTQ